MKSQEEDIKYFDYIDQVFKITFNTLKNRPVDDELVKDFIKLLGVAWDDMNESGLFGHIEYDMDYELDDGIIYNIFIRLVDDGRESGFMISFTHNVCDIKRVR